MEAKRALNMENGGRAVATGWREREKIEEELARIWNSRLFTLFTVSKRDPFAFTETRVLAPRLNELTSLLHTFIIKEFYYLPPIIDE